MLYSYGLTVRKTANTKENFYRDTREIFCYKNSTNLEHHHSVDTKTNSLLLMAAGDNNLQLTSPLKTSNFGAQYMMC
jgi:hypothetical protein